MADFVIEILTLVSVWFTLWFGLSPAVVETTVVPFATTTAVVTMVIDGDTIEVRLASSSSLERLRYIGIDTPERNLHSTPECGAEAARVANAALVEGETVIVVPGRDPRDDYGRLLAYVYHEATFVNEVLVRDGWATALTISPNTDFAARFVEYEREATLERRGNWAMCSN
jgi:micrococcal nuclease